jgi:RNA polymerase sigma factor (sigma-70 family)
MRPIVDWEVLVRRYGRVLGGYVVRALRDSGVRPVPEEVEELIQEVYCRLLAGRMRPPREDEGRLVRFLGRIAQRVVLDQRRAAAAAKRGRDQVIPLDRREVERAPDPGATPEELVLMEECRRLLLARCRVLVGFSLTEKDRERNLRILSLALLEGWTSREIARAEGGRLAASTVDTLVYRAKQRLARHGLNFLSR